MELKYIVGEYHSKNVLIRSLFLQRLVEAIKLARPRLQKKHTASIIDIGCGEGLLLKLIYKQFPYASMVGIDTEPNVLQLKMRIPADIRVTSVTETKLPDNTFDVAFCLDVLEHLTADQLQKAAREIKRILKPDGLLITSLPTETWFYKFCRLLAKGTMSPITGPDASPHIHTAQQVENLLSPLWFRKIQQKRIPRIAPFSLFHITTFVS